MQCVILAAGRGTRMLPLTESVPKPLLAIAGKPILEWNLENLPREITEVIFVIGYLGDKIRTFVRPLGTNKKTTFVKQRKLNGTAGALLLCKDQLAERFMVINGDDLYHTEDLARLLAHKIAILGYWSKTWRGSSLLLDDARHLSGIEENPPTKEEKIANTGAYMLTHNFFNYSPVAIKHGKELSIPHTLVSMSRDHNIVVERASFWKQINAPTDLKSATTQ